MVDRLQLYNAALGHLGSVRLLELDEDRGDRRELDAVYDRALLYCLEQGNWRFAMRTAELSEDTGQTPAFGTRTSAFVRPDDFVRLAGFSSDENFVGEVDFQQDGDLWYVNQSPAYVRYVSKDTSYGLNLGLYPANYTEAVGAWIACQAAIPVTKDASIKDRCLAYHTKFLNRARELEAIGDAVKTMPRGNWASSRYGRGRVLHRAGGRMQIRG